MASLDEVFLIAARRPAPRPLRMTRLPNRPGRHPACERTMAKPCLLDLLVLVSRRPSPLWPRLTDAPTVRQAWADAIGDLAQRRQMKRCYPQPQLLALRLTSLG